MLVHISQTKALLENGEQETSGKIVSGGVMVSTSLSTVSTSLVMVATSLAMVATSLVKVSISLVKVSISLVMVATSLVNRWFYKFLIYFSNFSDFMGDTSNEKKIPRSMDRLLKGGAV